MSFIGSIVLPQGDLMKRRIGMGLILVFAATLSLPAFAQAKRAEKLDARAKVISNARDLAMVAPTEGISSERVHASKPP